MEPAVLTDVGSITDVAGIRVGHAERTARGWLTGTTVVMAPAGATAGVDVRGGAPGTRETDALAPWNLVDRIHAVCLTGGSAYGLRAADGVMDLLAERGLGFSVGEDPSAVVPVVPAAVIFDLGRGGAFGNRPDAAFGRRAAERASPTERRRGSLGAGTGARAGGIRGGVGMASRRVRLPGEGGDPGVEVSVGALCVVNARGSVIDPSTGLPYEAHPDLRRPSVAERRALVDHCQQMSPSLANTTIGVVATDAALTRPEATRLAMSAHDGLARAIRPVHTIVDGDSMFSMATGVVELGEADRIRRVSALLAAAVDCVAMACVDAVVSAQPTADFASYLSLCPSAVRR